MPSDDVGSFGFATSHPIVVFVGDVAPEDVIGQPVARNLPGFTIRHIAEAFEGQNSEDETMYSSASRSSSGSPPRSHQMDTW